MASMVGPVSPRVTSNDGLYQDDHHGEERRLQAHSGGTNLHSSHSRQQHPKQYSGVESENRIGHKNTKRTNQRMSGGSDMNGRMNPPSAASSSGRSYAPSNLDRFLEVTTPRVRTQYLPKSCLLYSSQKRCANPEETLYFNLGDLWDSFDEWSAYGAGVPLVLNGDESVVQYYVPYLSALQLYTRPDWPDRFRNGGAESDVSSEASSDSEVDGSRPIRRPSVNSSRLECASFRDDNNEEVEVWSYFETISPYSRVPLIDKIADLSRGFEPGQDPLRSLRSLDLLPNSWFSVAWYPIYRIPTGPTLRDLDACFLTFHPLSKPLKAEDTFMRPSCCRDVCVTQTVPALEPQPLRAFGLASYKLRGAVWASNPERRQVVTLQKSADDHLKHLRVQHLHSDFNYFTSRSTPTRR